MVSLYYRQSGLVVVDFRHIFQVRSLPGHYHGESHDVVVLGYNALLPTTRRRNKNFAKRARLKIICLHSAKDYSYCVWDAFLIKESCVWRLQRWWRLCLHTKHERMTAFAMCQHRRLGMHSEACELSLELIRDIFMLSLCP
jgi:hypothetical protein